MGVVRAFWAVGLVGFRRCRNKDDLMTGSFNGVFHSFVLVINAGMRLLSKQTTFHRKETREQFHDNIKEILFNEAPTVL